MINLRNDYCAIAHPKILSELQKHQNETFVGYGLDEYSKMAEDVIKQEIGNKDISVYFTAGGTSTNKIVIDHFLKHYEAVICCDTGHINVHETGAIEANGNKVLTVPNHLGKITPNQIEKVLINHPDFHMVKPKMVYISNSTEYGTVYTLEELTAISNICKKNNLYFYIDGARLGTALTSKVCNYTIKDLAKLCDAFYIGGTKNGLMFGEALIVNNQVLNQEIRYSIKNNGGLLAKGFITGLMFKTLFTDNLFYEIAGKQNELAELLEVNLKALGIKCLMERHTNQIFPIFTIEQFEKIKNEIMFEIWEQNENNIIVRFVTHFLLSIDDIIDAVNIIKKAL